MELSTRCCAAVITTGAALFDSFGCVKPVESGERGRDGQVLQFGVAVPRGFVPLHLDAFFGVDCLRLDASICTVRHTHTSGFPRIQTWLGGTTTPTLNRAIESILNPQVTASIKPTTAARDAISYTTAARSRKPPLHPQLPQTQQQQQLVANISIKTEHSISNNTIPSHPKPVHPVTHP